MGETSSAVAGSRAGRGKREERRGRTGADEDVVGPAPAALAWRGDGR